MVKIEDYRGWEISFDTDNETFVAYSNFYDSDVKKQSYASCKKYIDDFIKENTHFKPLIVSAYRRSETLQRIKIIGIRKDGKFISETPKGKSSISGYDEKDYFIWDDKYKPIIEEHQRLCKIADVAYKAARDYLDANLIVETLEDYRKKHLNN